jgi:nickel-dependent lactate racemase
MYGSLPQQKGDGSMHADLKYGEGTVRLSLEGAASVTYLEERPTPVITDLNTAFLQAVTTGCIGSASLKDIIKPYDKVTVVISDITRFWMRQDRICPLLADYLCREMGVREEDILFLAAVGTHRQQTPQELETLVSPQVFSRFSVVNHDCEGSLVTVGTTSRGTLVRVNPLAVNRKVILIGGTVHHLMSGFGGGRKSILPGISGEDSIFQNHIHSLDPDAPRSSLKIGMGVLAGNPVHEDMVEAAQLVNPAFSINLVVNSQQELCALYCGHWLHAWEESCKKVQELFGLPIAKKADVVIASCGGYPKDINLYQAVKTLLNASQALKDGGTLVFLAQCREGGGTPAFFDWIKPLREGRLDAELRAGFTISGYIFYAACEAIAKARVLMLTQLMPEVVAPMALEAYDDVAALLNKLDLLGKDVYVMPFGGGIVPYVAGGK